MSPSHIALSSAARGHVASSSASKLMCTVEDAREPEPQFPAHDASICLLVLGAALVALMLPQKTSV